MIRTMVLAAAVASLGAHAGAARAQTGDPAAAAQALSQCLVLKTTGADRLTVARWLLASMASAPQMKDVTTIAPEAKVRFDREMAALFTRLLVTDCPAESRAVFRFKSEQGFRTAGEALGRVAMSELLGNKDAAAALEAYTRFLDENDFKPLLP